MISQYPRTWALLGHRKGDNNQVLALAEELGWPFETRSLRYNLLRALKADLIGPSLASVERQARRFIRPPWPDLLIAIGRRSVPVARYVRRKSRGRTKLVLIGHPRVDPRDFDLVITTRQYPVPPHPNVLLLPMAMSRLQVAVDPSPAERAWLAALPRPHLLMAIGGSTKYYDLAPAEVARAATSLITRAERQGGTFIAIGSPRTEPDVLLSAEEALAGTRHVLVKEQMPRFPVLMGDADEIFVTADSLSMMSEAMQTGHPVGMIPVALNEVGRKWLGAEGVPGKGKGKRRDMSRIWDDLHEKRLIGSVETPIASNVENPVVTAAATVRRLFEGDQRSA